MSVLRAGNVLDQRDEIASILFCIRDHRSKAKRKTGRRAWAVAQQEYSSGIINFARTTRHKKKVVKNRGGVYKKLFCRAHASEAENGGT